MIRRHTTALHLALMAFDAMAAMLTLVVVSVVTTALRQPGVDWQAAWHHAGLDPFVIAGLYSAAWVGIVWLQGLYRVRTRMSLRREVLDVARSVTLLAVATFTLLFLVKLPDVSRLLLAVLFLAQFAVALATRLAVRAVLAQLRRRGYNTRYMLVVGSHPSGEELVTRLERRVDLGLGVTGVLLEPGPANLPAVSPTGRPVLGWVDDLEDVLHTGVVDEVVVALDPARQELVGPIARLCEEEGRIVRVPVPSEGLTMTGGQIETIEGIPVLSLVYGPDRAVSLALKRVLDVVVASAALVLFSPILAGIAVAIVALDGRPVLFRQTRVGLNGRPFSVVKFRTMTTDAEDQLEELLEHNELSGQAFKLTDDPRVTRTGRWLRRTSLDELPQFWNALRGEMSVVGPRPPLPREVEGYDVWHRRRLSMKPGITGLWQVSARREEDFDRWVELDLDYIDRWSLWLDVKIMARTVPAMLQGR